MLAVFLNLIIRRGSLCRRGGITGQFPVRTQQQKRRHLGPAQTNQLSSGMLLAFIKSILPPLFADCAATGGPHDHYGHGAGRRH